MRRSIDRGGMVPGSGSAYFVVAFLVLALVGAGCDSAPSVAERYTVIVDWTGEVPPLGVAAVDIWAPGFRAATALDEARIWTNTFPSGWTRVLLIHPGTPAALRFTVELTDVGAPPQAVLNNLATQANQPILPGAGYRVRVVRNP